MILVTGGAGYIGSHTIISLLEADYEVLALDNLSNSSKESLSRIAAITGRVPKFIEGDVRDVGLLNHIFRTEQVDAVIHFAGLKAVGESVSKPLCYYENNITGTLTLLQQMAVAGCYNFAFSSSATVYGNPSELPISESCPTGALSNPYGRSKLMIEQVLADLACSDSRWSIACLRYFNPIGAHESGMIGEDPNGIPSNLMPFISQVAIGALPKVSVFGGDYPTHDGTGIRDYIHVVDLAEGHLLALDYISSSRGLNVWNLGTGKGYSVLDMICAFEKASGKKIPFTIEAPRKGDVAKCWADPSKAFNELGWKAKRSLDDMMKDTWRWQVKNPFGYLGAKDPI